MNKLPENILIARTDRIGDVVLSLPLAYIIKKHFPDSKISYLVRNYTKDLLQNHPFIDNTIILSEKDGKPNFTENINKIKSMNFDTAFVVNPTFKIALILFLSGIKTRVGTGYRWYSFLFNKKIYEHRKYGEKHELEFNINMLKMIGITNVDPKDVVFDIQISEKSRQNVNDILKKNGFNQDIPTVIVHPGSGGSAIDLPIYKMKELTGLLAQELNINLVVTGTVAEKEICDSVSQNISKIINLAGKINLSELMALINRADILIANSTGPIHIASALGKFVVGFYPLIPSCSPNRWGPYTGKKLVFSPEIECENCNRRKCEKINCMDSININEVFVKIKNVLVSTSN